MSNEPRTAAGRALLDDPDNGYPIDPHKPFGTEWRAGLSRHILAIEAEAERPWREALAEHARSPEHYAIEDEARAEIDVETLRERLRIAYITHPDDSHGEVYVNRGIKTALRIIADLVGDLDLYSPCEPDADPRQTADVWCKAHVAFMGSQWSCELAQAPWVWRDARLQEHKR